LHFKEKKDGQEFAKGFLSFFSNRNELNPMEFVFFRQFFLHVVNGTVSRDSG
jgi:hypothetical protein